MSKLWHALPSDAVLDSLQSSRKGLSVSDAEYRLGQRGQNILPHEKPYSKLRLFLGQFHNPLVYILLVACGISAYLGHYSDAIFIIIVLLTNTSVGFYQENKANASLLALRKLVTLSARVMRQGSRLEVDSALLVPGDIVLLKAGDKVPADLRLIEAQGLKIDESSLTGEWIAVTKNAEQVVSETQLADRKDMAYMGSIVEEGSAIGVVIATGTDTAIGQIVALLRETKERPTPLQNKIAYLSRLVGAFIFVVISFVVGLGYLEGKPFTDIFIAALALAVSAIPAGLLPAITVILVLGMRRILKSNGLVRKLVANETLGSVTVICTDKTGTITEGKMQVSHILTGTHELLADNQSPLIKPKQQNGLESHIVALKAAVLTSDAFIENPDNEFSEWIVRGVPTERALVVAGAHAGLSKRHLEEEYPAIARLHFTSESKFAASLHLKPDGSRVLYVVGAPEIVAERSHDFHVDGTTERLNSAAHIRLLAKLEHLTSTGLRVVACAHREFTEHEELPTDIRELIEKLTLVGYIALKDPLRADARQSIELTKRAGIRTVLITGDHRLTAQSIATEVGIVAAPDMILEGKELDTLSDTELIRRVQTIAIYARVSPQHKLRIVKALQTNGAIVAMIGDGVNDAPALKAADVGVAVGSGTDVAKEVADIVLLDNSFSTIVRAIEQGRVIFQNIRKVFVYLIADDFAELFVFVGAMIFNLPLPLLAAQILWINLVEDGLPDISLTVEQEIAGVMDEPPRAINEPILNKPLKQWMISVLAISGIASFLLFYIYYTASLDIERARVIVFSLMCIDSLVFAFSVRSFKKPIWRKDIFSNHFLVWAAIVGMLMLAAGLYLPPLQRLLSTQPLALIDWMLIITVSTIEIVFIEWFKKRTFSPVLVRT